MRGRNSTTAVGGWRSCLIAVVSTLAASTPVWAHHQPTHEGANIGVAIATPWPKRSPRPIAPERAGGVRHASRMRGCKGG
jgi:hypothetical protein